MSTADLFADPTHAFAPKRARTPKADYVGQVFQNRVVVRLVSERKHSFTHGPRKHELIRKWWVRCLACGHETGCDQSRLRKAQCAPCCVAARTKLPDEVLAKATLSRMCNTHERKGFAACTLSLERVLQLVKGNCEYCGTPPGRMSRGGKHATLVNGVDRIDSSRGYEEGNVASCCRECNVAKGARSVDEFRAWLRRAAAFQLI